MAIYKYKVMKPSGETITGELNRKSEYEVQGYLKEKEYFIIEIKPAKQTDIFNVNVKSKVRAKDLSIFCRKLHAMIDSGLPIVTAIDILRDQTVNSRIKRALHKIFEDLQKGLTFSEALARRRDIFPENMIFLIEAGEMSGAIDTILDRLAIDFENEAKIRNKINSALVYPALLILATIALVVFMMVFILPRFIYMFDNAGVDLPWLTRQVIGLSESIKSFWYVYLIVVIAIAAVVKLLRREPSIRRWMDKVKLNIPGFKKYNQLLITTRFTRTLATMLFSGVPLLQSLENISRSVGNIIVSEKIVEVTKEVRRGSDLATPIKKMKVFPRMVDSMINIGEESGSLDDILIKTTSYFDDELEHTIKRMTQLFEPLMILVMGVVVGTVVLSMVIPMFEMANVV
ncbi:type II secretion system F family protein [Acidaminobacter sp. JC074]|uniref:type II secretion system F family protein n=1 Tax=Acidaminobacter sp. JC074 TaxID=2530199 RepID=UPI001F0EBB1A|nr:type II secretion system F family protein [Acidaminobacter sp. JC074]MCH4888550.1 type II secretion system F family protein [Acidaminobacter sp. JC074]